MLRIYLVDDDKIIRRGLRVIIEKSTGQYQIVGEADNGLKALEEVRILQPDILLVDIRMPVMGGIELIKKLQEQRMRMKVIVLSGFDDYQYVRESMKCGAMDYLLKPIENEELLQAIRKAGEDIQREQAENDMKNHSLQFTQADEQHLRDNLILRAATGKSVPDAEYGQVMHKAGLETNSPIMLALVQRNSVYTQKRKPDMPVGPENLDFSEYIRRKLDISQSGRIVLLDSDRQVIIVFVDNHAHDDFKAMVTSELQKLLDLGANEDESSISIGLSDTFQDMTMIHTAFLQSQDALWSQFYQGKGRLAKYNRETCQYLDQPKYDQAKLMSTMLRQIDIGDSEGVIKTLRDIYDDLAERHLRPDRFKGICLKIVDRLMAMCPELDEIVSDFREEFDLASAIKEIDTLNELRDYMLRAFSSAMLKINLIRKGRSRKSIELAKDYIKKHYNEKITLKAIADYVYLNPTYFCEYFKNEMGISFISYLTEIRINAAKKLLTKPELKIYEIAQMVGYNDQTTYIRAFKKVVGVSPSEYRNIIR